MKCHSHTKSAIAIRSERNWGINFPPGSSGYQAREQKARLCGPAYQLPHIDPANGLR
jgi:hypothetical protein